MKNTILAIAVLAAITLFSCSQEPGDPGSQNPTVYVGTVTKSGAYYVNGTKQGNLDVPVDPWDLRCTVSGGKVYVYSRYYDDGATKYAYWANGVRTDLSVPDGYTSGYIRFFTVSNGKVYAAVDYYGGSTRKYGYWVDGVRTDLSVPDGYTLYENLFFTVSNGKVYAAGGYRNGDNYDEESRKACYWIDGVRTDLDIPAGFERSSAGTITVSGGKVYVVGSYSDDRNFGYTEKACYWVDGVRTDLDIPAGFERSSAGNLTVSGGKVYVPGYYGNHEDYYDRRACYWVDGTRIDLNVPDGSERSSAGNLTISGGKVYMLGNYDHYDDGYNKFCYWVDGTRTDLIVPNEAEEIFYPYYFAVSDGKVYVYGDTCPNQRVYHNYHKAFYWVDGVRADFNVSHYSFEGFGFRSFAITGGKVHIVAMSGNRDQGSDPDPGPGPFETAWYWIDGVKQVLPDAYNIAAIALVAE